MNDSLLRWGILLNLTAAVVGGIVFGSLWLARLPPAQTAGQAPATHEHKLTFTDPNPRQAITNMNNAITNVSSAIKELAAARQAAAENGRYQPVPRDADGSEPRFFDTRTGALKAATP
jgi:hypothetical protein